jgi:hypothetical protein
MVMATNSAAQAATHQDTREDRGLDHRDGEPASHEQPGERPRIAFHYHQFNHGCYGDHCPESGLLYAAWQAAVGKGRSRPGA